MADENQETPGINLKGIESRIDSLTADFGVDSDDTEESELGLEEDGSEDESEDATPSEEEEEDGAEEEEDPEEEGDPEEDADEEEGESFLSAKSLRDHQAEIKKNPALNAVYKSMMRDYTQKTQQLSGVRRDYEKAYGEIQELTENLNDLGDGGGRETFLMEAALENPDVFQRAFDRAAELLADSEKRKAYEQQQKVDAKDRDVRRREADVAERAVAEQETALRNTMKAEAKRLGITSAVGMKLAGTNVAEVIRAHFREHGDLNVPKRDVVAAVREAAKELAEERGGVKKEAKSEEQARRLKDAKETVKNSKRPQPLRGKSPPVSVPTPPKKEELPKGVSTIDARIDQFVLGG